ncbi:hypothetical protein ACW9HQ_44860, partial [Nocardia gipuzkoensis]
DTRQPTTDGDALFAFLSLQTSPPPVEQLQRRFASAYKGSVSNEAMVSNMDLSRYDVVPLFGRFHVFARAA